MLRRSSTIHQSNLFGTDLLMQLDASDPLLKLVDAIPWQEFDEAFSLYYTRSTGAPSKPIRLMAGLLILKQLENLSNKSIVLQWKHNPYYQAFLRHEGVPAEAALPQYTARNWYIFASA